MTFDIRNFRIGSRVELHPATDLWMRGARFGAVIGIGRKLLRVRLDRTGRAVKVNPANIAAIIE